MTPIQLKKIIINILGEHKATNINAFDVREITDIADYLIICSATSSRHIKALSDHIIEQVKKHNIKPLGHEGRKGEQGWALIDLGDFIVHIMLPEIREFYNLEKLWDVSPAAKAEKASKKAAKEKIKKAVKAKEKTKANKLKKTAKVTKINKTKANAKKIKAKIKHVKVNTKIKLKPKPKSIAAKKAIAAKNAKAKSGTAKKTRSSTVKKAKSGTIIKKKSPTKTTLKKRKA